MSFEVDVLDTDTSFELSDIENLLESHFDHHGTDTTWTFTFTTGDYIGYTLTLVGTGFTAGDAHDDFPSATGKITGIKFGNSEHLLLDVSGIDLSVAELRDHLPDRSIIAGDTNDDLAGSEGDDTVDSGGGDDHIHGGGGNDHIDAGDGNDNVDGGDGTDTVHGDGGNDTETGDAGGDVLFGDAGNDKEIGGGGNDRLNGGSGADRLSGGAGKDKVEGGAGADVLNGGANNDVLAGGGGHDRFQFNGHFGIDVITDFQVGQDHIDLRGAGLSFDDLTIVHNFDNTTIVTSLGKIVLSHVAEVHASDFLF